MMAETPETRVGVYQSVEVKAVGEDEFVNKVLWRGELRSAYGGQIVGQALMAACHTISDPDLLLISAHCYFMSPVKTTEQVTYHVTRTKDGRSFSSRSVEAFQGGKMVFHILASFKRPEANPQNLSHSPVGIPRGVFPPDDPREDRERVFFNQRIGYSASPFDACYCFREMNQEKLLAGEPLPPRMLSWIRCHGEFPQSCSQNEHRVYLAFLSDYALAFPLKLKYPGFRGFMTSLDHTIWFHGPVYCQNNWFLLDTKCVQAEGGLSLNSCRIFCEDGTLVASCQQQALYRLNSKL